MKKRKTKTPMLIYPKHNDILAGAEWSNELLFILQRRIPGLSGKKIKQNPDQPNLDQDQGQGPEHQSDLDARGAEAQFLSQDPKDTKDTKDHLFATATTELTDLEWDLL